MSKNIRLSGIRNESNTNLLKRITCLALASISLASLGACKNKENNNNPVDIPTTPIETQTPTPESTPIEIVIETPAPTEFSYESVFSEIFSNEELAKLYPEIEDYDKERERIYSNISRIEDFEFYQLTEEEQEFIKGAQAGSIDSSKEAELREVLTKIISNDPYVFDDVDNEVKIDNRINNLIPNLQKMDIGIVDSKMYEIIRQIIIVSNCGNIENISTETGHIMLNMSAGKMINQTYFYQTVVPDYKSGNWKGNYSVFDFSKFLLDGSGGQEIAKKLYESNVKLFNSKKEDIEKNLKEIVGECLDILLINDALQNPGGINSINSKVHRAIIYDYCYYYVLHSVSDIAPNNTYSIPNEYAEKVGLLNTSLNLNDIDALIKKYLGSRESIYSEGVEELEEAQGKYRSEPNLTLKK